MGDDDDAAGEDDLGGSESEYGTPEGRSTSLGVASFSDEENGEDVCRFFAEENNEHHHHHHNNHRRRRRRRRRDDVAEAKANVIGDEETPNKSLLRARQK